LLNRSFFLWPESKIIKGLISCWKLIPTERVEDKLFQMFPSGYPVLCSSGRAALTLAIEKSDKNRGDLVGLFPYASHCVIEAVSRVTTPLSGPTAIHADLRIVYHQWGYVQEKNLPLNTIEDCVDTLCVPGTKLFPSGGSFEIWSLPKILGTTSGAVLWCKNQQVAERLRTQLKSKKGGLSQWILRLISKKFFFYYNYWQGAEAIRGRISLLQNGEIYNAIEKWHLIVEDRLKKLDLTWDLSVSWLQKPSNRLPSVVPIDCLISENEIISIGLTSGSRVIEQIQQDGTRKLIKVIPIPIHQDVGIIDVIKIIELLNKNKKI
jgi:putative PLP-dependent aminotransferase (TIGR04422 family)